MSIRVEGDKLIRDYWIEYIQYRPAEGGATHQGEEGTFHWRKEALAIVMTDGGTYTLEGEKAEALRDHPKAQPGYVKMAKLRLASQEI